MKLLIIGSEGFIGKNCSAFFKKKGFDIYKADIIHINEVNYFHLSPVNTVFDKLFENNKFNICINASGAAEVGFSFQAPDIDFELNVWNITKILNGLRLHNPDCKFINFSSAAVYGNPVILPINENDQVKPVSPYGFHKLQSEQILKEYNLFYGIQTCSLRVFSAYGTGLKKQLFWDLYNKSLKSKVVELFGTGEETRDFIFISDILEAIDLIIQGSDFKADVVNIASGKEIKIKTAAMYFYELFDSSVKVIFTGKFKSGYPNNWQADINKLKNYGFIPKYELADGLEKYIQWLKENESH